MKNVMCTGVGRTKSYW